MTDMLELLRTQRWDDHRYYHHSRMNQSLHLLSATTFVLAYVVAFRDPAMAALLAWLIAMTSRQAGHFFFEPRDYDHVNDATHEHKEEIKVGYNLRRKVVLMTVWALSPLIFVLTPTMFGVCERAPNAVWFARHVGMLWLALAGAGILFRVAQLAVGQDWRVGVVWATKIVTDPFHDIRLYHRAPFELLRRDRLAGVVGEEAQAEDVRVTG